MTDDKIQRCRKTLRFIVVLALVACGLQLATVLAMLTHDFHSFVAMWGKPFATLGLFVTGQLILTFLLAWLAWAALKFMRAAGGPQTESPSHAELTN